MFLKHLQLPFTQKISLFSWSVTFVGMSVLWYIYSDIEYVAANYRSYTFAYFDTFLSWIVILLFPFLIAGIVYRSFLFWKRNSLKKTTGIGGIVSGIIGVCITGAACCWVSLISVLGFTSIITFFDILPYHGIEIKTLSVIILIYAVGDLYRSLTTCALKK